MKRFFKIIGIICTVIVALLILLIVVAAMNSSDADEQFTPFINEAIPKLASWDRQPYQDLMTEEGFSALSDNQWNLYLSKVSRLGHLVSIGEPEQQSVVSSSYTSSGSSVKAQYLVPVEFDTGPAHITLTLIEQDEQIRIHYIKLHSDLLLE